MHSLSFREQLSRENRLRLRRSCNDVIEYVWRIGHSSQTRSRVAALAW